MPEENTTDIKSFENVKYMIEQAGRKCGLTDEQIEFLKTPEKEIKGHITIPTETGGIETVPAFIILHRNPRRDDPFKGGIRIGKDVNRDMIRILATEMTFKSWLNDLPFGGGKSGIVCEPPNQKTKKFEHLARGFVIVFHRDIGSFIYVPAPDMGSNQNFMYYIWDQCRIMHPNEDVKGFVTGKPPEIGGCQLREEATGRGMCIVQEIMLDHFNFRKNAGDISIAIQGFGNVGSHYARISFEQGFKIIAVSDINDGIYNSRGLNINKLLDHVKEAETVIGFPDSDRITNEELISLNCDILAPCAVASALNESNANKVRARFIKEGGNAVTTPRADEIFKEKGIIVSPDILDNSGGLITSFFEWSKNISHSVIMEHNEVIINELERYLQKSTKAVLETAENFNESLRMAAYILPIKKMKYFYDKTGWSTV